MDFDITIIGAGVVGLAIANELSKYYNNIVVIEKNNTFGQETSSRNSEVIHSGIYYPAGSLKAKLCVEGKKLLFGYCKEKGIKHKIIGKLLVATNKEEEKQLKVILNKAKANGVDDARKLALDEIKNIEPYIFATSALYFPTTGIIDSWGLMKQLETEAIRNGAQFVYGTKVVGINKITNGYEITLHDKNGNDTFTSSMVINSAGLFSDKVSEMAGIVDERYSLHFWKGEYFSVHNGKHKYIQHLIYPVPHPENISLGVHATLDINNRLKLGPNAIYLPIKNIDYTVDKTHKNLFYESVKKMLPFIELNDLEPDQAGIRPKLQKPGDAVRDFIIENEKDKGFNNFINLIGIESPGLTSCLAIARKVKNLIV